MRLGSIVLRDVHSRKASLPSAWPCRQSSRGWIDERHTHREVLEGTRYNTDLQYGPKRYFPNQLSQIENM